MWLPGLLPGFWEVRMWREFLVAVVWFVRLVVDPLVWDGMPARGSPLVWDGASECDGLSAAGESQVLVVVEGWDSMFGRVV